MSEFDTSREEHITPGAASEVTHLWRAIDDLKRELEKVGNHSASIPLILSRLDHIDSELKNLVRQNEAISARLNLFDERFGRVSQKVQMGADITSQNKTSTNGKIDEINERSGELLAQVLILLSIASIVIGGIVWLIKVY